ncbi:MAG TPA: hypothetical protein VHO70_22115 [Chitinispirillaceae bacterium]|nr:hypothetical protein [Chitinispirillaceae bacterium]
MICFIRTVLLLFVFIAIICCGCSSPTEVTDGPVTPQFSYTEIKGGSGNKNDMSGSVSGNNGIQTLNVSKTEGLWGSWEEIGFFYTEVPESVFTISAVYKGMSGGDSILQGGLMVRGSLDSKSAYAALRLIQNKYDPVVRTTAEKDASASSSTIPYLDGDVLYISCTGVSVVNALHTLAFEVGAKRNESVIVSKTFSITSSGDKLYAGFFGANHSSTVSGSFSVSDLKILN